MKTPDQNDLQIGTVVVLDIVSKSIDFGFKRSGLGLELGWGWVGVYMV